MRTDKPRAVVYIYIVFRDQLPFTLLAKVKKLDPCEKIKEEFASA